MWRSYDMEGHTLNKYNQAARSSGMSVLWFAQPLAQREFSRLVNEDFLVAFASVLFVWCCLMYIWGHALLVLWPCSKCVSLPLSLFFTASCSMISYFAGMQILVVFVILGIGADDCFVFVDAWKQSLLFMMIFTKDCSMLIVSITSMANRPDDGGRVLGDRDFADHAHRGVRYLRGDLRPDELCAGDGVMPAVLIWHHNSSKCCTCSRKEIVEGGTCVERYLTILSWRKKIIAKVLVLVLGGLSCRRPT